MKDEGEVAIKEIKKEFKYCGENNLPENTRELRPDF